MVISCTLVPGKHHHSKMAGILLFLAGLLLTGCQGSIPASEAMGTKPALLPEGRLTDYRTTSCSNIWLKPEYEVQENPLYWLRAMDCASTLPHAQIQLMVDDIMVNTWADALKQGVLLSAIDISLEQRQKMLNMINKYRMHIPSSLFPLLQLWRDQQLSLLDLQKEQRKYRQLQSIADNKIDALKEQESHLLYQLEEMEKKVAGLTEIERQLSSRKQLQGNLPAENFATEKPSTEKLSTEKLSTEKQGTAEKQSVNQNLSIEKVPAGNKKSGVTQQSPSMVNKKQAEKHEQSTVGAAAALSHTEPVVAPKVQQHEEQE